MTDSELVKEKLAPVAVGGVGGSGTRLIALFLKRLDFHIGDDLNSALDNLWFTLLFKREEILSSNKAEFETLVNIFVKKMTLGDAYSQTEIGLVKRLASHDRSQHPISWLQERERSLLSRKPLLNQGRAWGWKEPNSHIVMERFQKKIPDMKYIHVVRNGLDMAYSDNQNQLKLWGRHFLGDNHQISPRFSLKYWHIVHRRVLEICEPMGSRFLFLNYDELCLSPSKSIKKLMNFLGVENSEVTVEELTGLVKVPKSFGRFKDFGLEEFDPVDVDFVKQLGFDTSLSQD